jgi:hypothetical protein
VALGTQLFTVPPTLHNTNAVVPWLLDKLPKRTEGGYVVYLDNLFTSIKLLKYLLIQGYGACGNITIFKPSLQVLILIGTCRTNSGICKELVELKKAWTKNNAIPWGSYRQYPSIDNCILQSLWNDSAPTLMLSTAHHPITIDPALVDNVNIERTVGEKIGEHGEMIYSERKRSKNGGLNIQKAFSNQWTAILPIPTLHDDYNHHMNGPDTFDHLRSSISGDRRQRQGGWRSLFNFLVDIALINSFKLSGFNKKKGQIPFRRALVLGLLEIGGERPRKRKRASSNLERQHHYQVTHTFGRLKSPKVCIICQDHLEPTPKRRVLGVIDGNSGRNQATKKRSMYGCIICNIGVCKEGLEKGICFQKHCKSR